MGNLFDTPDAPKALNPTQVANSQYSENQRGIRQQVSANRLNQTDAFGNRLNYRQTGRDQYGNPIYSANQKLGQLGQQYSQGLAGLGQQYFQSAGDVGNLGSQQAFDNAYKYASANLEPRFEQSRAAMESRLRNQGLDPTSEAYRTGMNDLALQQNEARNNLVTGLQGQMFNQGMQQRQQGMNELQPGVQFGNQVLNPSYASVPGVSVGNTDMGQLYGLNQQGQWNNYNAQMQNQGSMLGGLAKIGTGLMGMFG